MAEEKLLGVQRLSTVQLGKDIARANEMLKTLGSGIKIDFGESVRQQLDSVLAEIKRVAEETKRAASSASKASGSASAGTFISQIDKLASVTTNYEAATNKATSAIARGWDAAKNKVVEYKNAEGKITRRTVTDDQGAAKQSKAVAQLAEAYVKLYNAQTKSQNSKPGSQTKSFWDSEAVAAQRSVDEIKRSMSSLGDVSALDAQAQAMNRVAAAKRRMDETTASAADANAAAQKKAENDEVNALANAYVKLNTAKMNAANSTPGSATEAYWKGQVAAAEEAVTAIKNGMDFLGDTSDLDRRAQAMDKVVASQERLNLATAQKADNTLNNMLKERYNLQLEIDKLESQRGGSKSDREARQRQLNSLKQEEARLTGQIESMKRDGISNNKLETDLMNKRSQIQKDLQAKQKQQTDAQKQHQGVLQKVSDTLVRMATFAIWRTMMNAWRNATSFAKEYYDALNEIRIITKESEMSANQMGNEFIDMAKRMSVSATEIAKAAVEFYRQGLSDSEVSNRLEWTIQYAKIAGLEFSEAAELVTAATNSMDLDCQRVVDVFAYLGDASASGADEIGQAMQKASASATEAGVSFEWLGAYIATVSEKTRQSPEVIGTAFNSMMARLHNIRAKGYNEDDDTKINDVAKALDKLPEKISLINALTGEWVDMSTIFEEIARQWTNLDDKTRAYIATTMAGTRQQNVFLTLMNDMAKAGEGASRAYELYAGAMNSSGAVSEKYGIYQESVQASLDSMIASWQEFVNVFQGGSSLKSIYGWVEKIIEVFTFAADSTNNWNIYLGAISLGLVVFAGILPKIVTGLKSVKDAITATFAALKAGEIASAGSKIALAISLLTALASVIMTLVPGIQGVNAEANKIDYDSVISSVERNIEKIGELKGRYEELAAKSSLTVEEQEEMRSIMESIKDLAPSYANSITSAQGDITRSIEITNRALNEQRNNLIELRAAQAQESLRDPENIKMWNTSIEDYGNLNKGLAFLNSVIPEGMTEDGFYEMVKHYGGRTIGADMSSNLFGDESRSGVLITSVLEDLMFKATGGWIPVGASNFTEKEYRELFRMYNSGQLSNIVGAAEYGIMDAMYGQVDTIITGITTDSLVSNLTTAQKDGLREQLFAELLGTISNTPNSQTSGLAEINSSMIDSLKNSAIGYASNPSALQGVVLDAIRATIESSFGVEDGYHYASQMVNSLGWNDDTFNSFAQATTDLFGSYSADYFDKMHGYYGGVSYEGFGDMKGIASHGLGWISDDLIDSEISADTALGFGNRVVNALISAGGYEEEDVAKSVANLWEALNGHLYEAQRDEIIAATNTLFEQQDNEGILAAYTELMNQIYDTLDVQNLLGYGLGEMDDSERVGFYENLFGEFGSNVNEESVQRFKEALEYIEGTDPEKFKQIKEAFIEDAGEELFEDLSDGAIDSQDNLKKLQKQITKMKFDKLEDAGKIMEGTADAFKNAEENSQEFEKNKSELITDTENLVKAYTAYNTILSSTDTSTEEYSQAMSDLSSYTGYSAEQLQSNMGNALSYLDTNAAATANTIAYLANSMLAVSGSSFDATAWGNGLLALGSDASAAEQDLFNLITTMIQVSGASIALTGDISNGTGRITVSGLGNTRTRRPGSGGDNDDSGGGGGGGGGGDKEDPTLDEKRMVAHMNWLLDLIEDAINRNDAIMSKFQTQGYLTGVINQLEQEAELLKEKNDLYEENLATLEAEMEKRKALLAGLTEGTQEYDDILAELGVLQDAYKDYSLALLENTNALLENEEAIKEQREAIRDMEIDLREELLEAIEDRQDREEAALDALIEMQEAVLDAIIARHEKERDEILRNNELKMEALQNEMDALDEAFEKRKRLSEEEDKQAKLLELEAQYARIVADPTRGKEALDIQNQILELRDEIAWDAAEDEVEAQKESLEQQMTSLEDYQEYIENYYEDLLENPRNFLDEVDSILSMSQEEILNWLRENTEEYQNSFDSSREQMENGWSETLDTMNGVLRDHWAEVEFIISQGDAAILEFLQTHRQDYLEAGKLQAEAFTDQWKEQLEDLRNAYLDIYEEVNQHPFLETEPTSTEDSSGGGGGGGGGTPAKKWYVVAPDGTKISGAFATEAEAKVTKYEETAYWEQSYNGARYGDPRLAQEYLDTWTKWRKSKVQQFARGGIANYTGLAWLDGSPSSPERILSPYQTKLFETLVSSLQTMASIRMPSLPVIAQQGSAQNLANTFGDIIVNVDSLDSDADYEALAKRVGDEILKLMNQGTVVGGIRYSF